MASSTKLVLVLLADMANPANGDTCWPSIAYIVKRTGLSERTIQSHLRKLQNLGHITMTQRIGMSTIYTVHPRNDCTPENAAPVQQSAKGGANKAQHPRSNRTQNVIPNNKLQPSDFGLQKWGSFEMPISPLHGLKGVDEASKKRPKIKEGRAVTILSDDFMRNFVNQSAKPSQ